jgi:PKHD-type hydroxylase
MLLTIEQALGAESRAELISLLRAGGQDWIDGRASAGHQGAAVKHHQQIDERSQTAARGQAIILGALERPALFISAALPNVVYPPLFNRYGEGLAFGAHVAGSVRIDPRTGGKLRADISATLFLSDPEDYDGGELEVSDSYGLHSVKLKAGDLILYPATSLHQVTRGELLASFFWIPSLVRDDGQRMLLFDLDTAIQRLGAGDEARLTLSGCYHNLLRQWAEV